MNAVAVELRLLLLRPRTWVTVALVAGLPLLVAVLVAVTDVAPRPGEGPAFLSQVLSNGRLLPAAALAIVLPVFLPVAVAVQAGDAVAGDSSRGTLRYLLLRPVGRLRLLVAKLVAVVVFVALLVTVTAALAYVAGVILFGTADGVASTSGSTLTTTEATWRTAVSVAYVGWSMTGLASVAFFFSTLTDSSLGAALAALAVLVGSTVLVGLDAAESFAPYLPTRYWLAFLDLYRDPVLWRDLLRGTALQGVYVGVFLGAAWASFMTKDVTS